MEEDIRRGISRNPSGLLNTLSGKGGIMLRLIHDRNVVILADESMLDSYSVLGK